MFDSKKKYVSRNRIGVAIVLIGPFIVNALLGTSASSSKESAAIHAPAAAAFRTDAR